MIRSMIAPLIALPLMLAVAGCGSTSATPGAEAAAAPAKAVAPPAGKAWVDVVTRTPEGGYMQGNPNAVVKLIEYGSRACPVCGRFAAEGMEPLRKGPIAEGKLAYEFREYPVHGALDLAPIVLGQCVAPTAFFPLLDQMFANQQTLLAKEEPVAKAVYAMQTANPGIKPQEVATYFSDNLGYTAFVKQFGVSEADARSCLADPKAYKAIETSAGEANAKYNISGTPTFIVNGNVVAGASSWDALKPALHAAGAM